MSVQETAGLNTTWRCAASQGPASPHRTRFAPPCELCALGSLAGARHMSSTAHEQTPMAAPCARSYELEVLKNTYIYDSNTRGYEYAPLSPPAIAPHVRACPRRLLPPSFHSVSSE